MSPGQLPCLKALDRDCFRAHPQFARRALAYRLLHLLIPDDLARLLPKTLRDPLVAPGVTVPLGAEFPPGTVLIPGCDFPAGWDPKDEPPECAKSKPLPTLAMMAAGGNPNVFLSPGEPGAGQVKPGPGPPPGEEEWFNEPWNDLTTNGWTATTGGTGTVSIVAGQLRLNAPNVFATAQVHRDHAFTWPTNARTEIILDWETAAGSCQYLPDTATYVPILSFNPPTEIRFDHGAGSNNYTVADYTTAPHTWKLTRLNDKASLQRDTDTPLIFEDITLTPGGPNTYDMLFQQVLGGISLIDNYTIYDL